jgi:hypothetical protein
MALTPTPLDSELTSRFLQNVVFKLIEMPKLLNRYLQQCRNEGVQTSEVGVWLSLRLFNDAEVI